MQLGPLGIRKMVGLHYYVRDLARSRTFYLERLGFAEIGRSSAQLEAAGKQRSLVFQAADVVVTCSTPVGHGGRAARYLAKHPDGIGTLAFEVEDIAHTFAELEKRGGTPISDIQRIEDDHGKLETFSITTPFGDTTFRFIQYHGSTGVFPGMERYAAPVFGSHGDNDVGFTEIDHITSNFQTMQPALLWLEHVFGCEPLWEVSFHTRDVARYEVREGSGLRSKVMWEPHSGVKFANNEPYRPAFKASQINVFNEEHRGDGVQHAALSVRDILSAVEKLKGRGVEFLPTPHTYYESLPERLKEIGVGEIPEDIPQLEKLQILVDGSSKGQYLLQIFLKESAGLYADTAAGPFFYEIIERKGDRGFGAGNFRALFESIERDQIQKGSA
jgi:4-hydroxyphenylpyruvate dioxygenase